MQRIFIELVRAPEQVVKEVVLALDVPRQQRLGEFALIPEVIEKPALGDADRGNQLVDRCGGKAFLQDGGFRHVEDALASVGAFAL
jgi:hypothetical protein